MACTIPLASSGSTVWPCLAQLVPEELGQRIFDKQGVGTPLVVPARFRQAAIERPLQVNPANEGQYHVGDDFGTSGTAEREHGLPVLEHDGGADVDNGRLPGAATALFWAPIRPKALGTPGCVEKSSIWLLSTIPVPGITTLEPKDVLTVAVSATQLPWASTAATCVV